MIQLTFHHVGNGWEMGTDHGFCNYPKTWSVPFFLVPPCGKWVGNGWEMGTDHGFCNYPKTWSVPFFRVPFFEVINGSDRKELIASYAVKFESILRATSSAPETK